MIRIRHGFALGSSVVLFGLSSLSQQQDVEKKIPSNLELIRSLAAQIGDSVGRDLGRNDTITMSTTVLPKDLAWYVEGALLSGLSRSRLNVRAASNTDCAAEFGLANARVEYSNVRREGFFGSKIVDRKVKVTVSTKVTDQRKGEILISRDFEAEQGDTIPLSDVEHVETVGLPLTHGSIPAEGFFSSIAEPLVLLGAIGVAVYLLFSVRS